MQVLLLPVPQEGWFGRKPKYSTVLKSTLTPRCIGSCLAENDNLRFEPVEIACHFEQIHVISRSLQLRRVVFNKVERVMWFMQMNF